MRFNVVVLFKEMPATTAKATAAVTATIIMRGENGGIGFNWWFLALMRLIIVFLYYQRWQGDCQKNGSSVRVSRLGTVVFLVAF